LNLDFPDRKDVAPELFALSVQVSPSSVFPQTLAFWAFFGCPLGENLEQASLEAKRLIDFLPSEVGSEQGPHQNTQSRSGKCLTKLIVEREV